MKNILIALAAVVALSTAAVAAEVRLPTAGQDGQISQTNRDRAVAKAVAAAKAAGTSTKEAARNAGAARNGTSGPGQQH